MLGQSWILPHQYQLFFWVWDCVVRAPSVSRQKYAWTILDPAPSVSHEFFCAWTIVDPAPSVSNIFFGCSIVWSVPHQYHDKNMLGQYWILPHQYHMIFFVLGQSWILPHEYQVRKYNFHKVKSWGGILWTVPHEYQVKK